MFFFKWVGSILVFRRAVCFYQTPENQLEPESSCVGKGNASRYKKSGVPCECLRVYCNCKRYFIMFICCHCKPKIVFLRICHTNITTLQYHVLPIFEMLRICHKWEKTNNSKDITYLYIPWIYRPPTMQSSPPALLHFRLGNPCHNCRR